MPHPADTTSMVSRWEIVAATKTALARGGASLRNIPGLLKRLIREETWREYVTPINTVERFETFTAFVTHPWGLDASLSLLQRICAEDLEALDVLDQVTTAHPGAKEGNQHAARKPVAAREEPQELFLPEDVEAKTNTDIVSNYSEREQAHGNARTYALRRLRESRPDLHARVLAGELSPHAGMIAAGFRQRETPLTTLHRVWRKVSPEDRARFLIEMLTPAERRLIQTGEWPEEDAC